MLGLVQLGPNLLSERRIAQQTGNQQANNLGGVGVHREQPQRPVRVTLQAHGDTHPLAAAAPVTAGTGRVVVVVVVATAAIGGRYCCLSAGASCVPAGSAILPTTWPSRRA